MGWLQMAGDVCFSWQCMGHHWTAKITLFILV
jgi:hypothetical protein